MKHTEKNNLVLERCGEILVLFIAFFLLSRAFVGQIWYAEIDSNALPVIAMQYHGSILMDESDLSLAQRDFPTLYDGINSYDDLRSAKLVQLPSGKWMAYYFPAYPFCALVVKLFLQAISHFSRFLRIIVLPVSLCV